jgi:hypothetical protein
MSCIISKLGRDAYINVNHVLHEVLSLSTGDEVLTQQCPCLRLLIHGESVGAWWIQQLQTKIGAHRNLPRLGPPEGKDLHPACLILYYWSCYNGAQMGSGYGRKRDGVC